jgi:hypothetical protein
MDRPWLRLPPDLLEGLRPMFEGVEELALQEVAVEDAATRENLELGLRQAVRRFLAEAGHPDVPADRSLFVLHGRLQQARGRSLEEMLGFYRAGARVLWRRAAELAVTRDLPAGIVAALADAVFAFHDDLATAAAEGFEQARADISVAADARRRQLLRALVRGAGPDEIEEAAALARWPLPARLVVLVAPGGHADALRAATAPAGLSDRLGAGDDDLGVALLPEGTPVPGGLPPCALSEPVTPDRAPVALRRAAALLAIRGETSAPIREADHRADLLLRADPELAEELAAARLAPLATLPPARRARLVETLRAWLHHPGRPQAMAQELHLHVQTVRYRLSVLRELLGDDLDDPGARFELAIALRIAR